MNIQEEPHGEVAVLTLSGRMMGGGETSDFRDYVGRVLHEQGITNIVVDLGRVQWMNSSAIGILAAGLKMARDDGGDIRLARVGERIISVFVSMQLERIFKSYPTVEAAIASFNMQIEEDAEGDVTVLKLGGTVMAGGDSDEFKETLDRALEEHDPPRIVVDMSDVCWMNSSAIGVLAACLKSARETGGDIRLAQVSQSAISVFGDMQLDKVFKSFDSVGDAVQSFAGNE